MFDVSTWSPEAVVIATLLALMVTVLLVVGAIVFQAGLFHSIEVKTKEPEVGELTVMYKSGRGAYSQSGALFTESHTLLPEYDTIGVYYDDPEKQSVDNLRYIVGLVVAEGDKEPNAEHVQLMQEHGFKKVTFPKVKTAVCADFPYKNTLSCIFSVFRVYPALREYIEQRDLCAHPFIEIYHNSSERILFIGPLEQQDCFKVPEVVEDPSLSPNEDSCDDDSVNDSVRLDEDEEGANDSDSRPGSAHEKNTEGQWEKSASIVDNNDGEESDTNTASSFEEIDPKETEKGEDTGPEDDQEDPLPKE